MNEISAWLSDTVSKLGSFVSNEMATILALVLFFLSYQLFRLAITGILQRNEPPESVRVAVIILPGVLLSVGGIVLMTNLGGVVLMILYISLTLVIGFGLAYLGYRLLDTSALTSQSEESFWDENPDFLKRVIPGALFALCGVVIIIASLSQGFDVIAEMQVLGREAHEKSLTLLDTRLQEGLKVINDNLRELRNTTTPR